MNRLLLILLLLVPSSAPAIMLVGFGGGGALPTSDDFDRASLGSSYTTIYSVNDLTIVSNQLAGSNAASNGAYRNDYASGGGMYSKIVLKTASAGGNAGVRARVQSGVKTYYEFVHELSDFTSAMSVSLARVNAGTWTELAATTHTFSANDNVEIRVTGSGTVTVSGYINGSLILTYDDSSADRLSGGFPGWYIYGTDVRLDDAAWGAYP